MRTAPRVASRMTSDLPTGDEKRAAVRQMFDSIAPRYDVVNKLMTFGLDRLWRRRTIGLLGLAPGSVVLDVACGTGDLARSLGRQGYRSVGLDISAGMLHNARAGTAPLVLADAASLPVGTSCVDGVVSGFALRNFSDLAAVFCELARVVRPGGRIALLDVSEPQSPVVRAGHRIWFTRVVPVLGGLISDGAAYRYLPKSVAYLPEFPAMRAMLEECGFTAVQRALPSAGIVQVITGTRS